MKTTYLIWKNPSCAGLNPEWQEITGKEFYALVRSSEAKGRYFIKLYSTEADSNDGAIVMETTKDDYVKWRKDKDHTDYVREQEQSSGIRTVSYHAMETEDGEVFGEELLSDKDSDIESQYIKNHQLEMALAVLNDEEKQIIEHLYLSNGKGTVRSYEEITGMPKSTVNRKQLATLEKLKKFFEG